MSLDLTINAKKSVCVRIGQRHNVECNQISVDGAKIAWSTSFKYLGISIKSGSTFSVDCKPARGAFYRSFNSIFCKIPKANEFAILSLVKTYCMPLVLYSLESICLNNSSLNQLDSLLLNAFGKIFKTYDRSILFQCMFYTNFLPMKLCYYKKRFVFLSKLSQHANLIVNKLFEISGKRELESLTDVLGLNANRCSVNTAAWKVFASSLGVSGYSDNQ